MFGTRTLDLMSSEIASVTLPPMRRSTHGQAARPMGRIRSLIVAARQAIDRAAEGSPLESLPRLSGYPY